MTAAPGVEAIGATMLAVRLAARAVGPSWTLVLVADADQPARCAQLVADELDGMLDPEVPVVVRTDEDLEAALRSAPTAVLLWAPVELDEPGALIDPQWADHQLGGGGRGAAAGAGRAAGDGADPRHQLAQPERLDDVVVGAELEQDHPVDLLAARRHHDDRHVAACPQPLAHHVALEVGETEVEQHQVGGAGRERGSNAVTVTRPPDP
jgi:hypothetical protein